MPIFLRILHIDNNSKRSSCPDNSNRNMGAKNTGNSYHSKDCCNNKPK